MIETISIREYEYLNVREHRNIAEKSISKDDALALQTILMNELPVFKWGYRKIYAQQWVGTVSLKNLNIEILPKLSNYIDSNDLRAVLTRMLLISHQVPSTKKIFGNIQTQKNSLIEIIISTFLTELEKYINDGVLNTYTKCNNNIKNIKGKILFNKQFSRNVLKIDRFWCSYSKFISNNHINQFLKLCLIEMLKATTDSFNKKRIKIFLLFFDSVEDVSKEKIISKKIVFTLINKRAEPSYCLGQLFIKNIFSSLSSGRTNMNIMLFDMNKLFEIFIYKSMKIIFKRNISYQKAGSYAISRDSDGKKFISLRPDITIKRDDNNFDIVDTKWKIPESFSKGSDVYQMNAYSTSLSSVNSIYLLYPFVQTKSSIGNYHFVDNNGNNRPLKIRAVDLLKCLKWEDFEKELKFIFM